MGGKAPEFYMWVKISNIERRGTGKIHQWAKLAPATSLAYKVVAFSVCLFFPQEKKSLLASTEQLTSLGMGKLGLVPAPPAMWTAAFSSPNLLSPSV